METKIETTNKGGKVLAYDGDQLVGQLDYTILVSRSELNLPFALPYRWTTGNIVTTGTSLFAVYKQQVGICQILQL